MFSQPLTQPYKALWWIKQKLHLAKHAKALESVVDVQKCMQCSSISEFEEILYSNMYESQDKSGHYGNQSGCHGYSGNHGYWERNNPMRDVDDISTPILCINSCDDPISLSKNIELDLFHYYPNFMLVLTENGGHCSFFEWKYRNGADESLTDCHLTSWAEDTALDYLLSVAIFMEKYDNNNVTK